VFICSKFAANSDLASRAVLAFVAAFIGLSAVARAAPPGRAVCVTRQELTARALGIVSKFHAADGAVVKKGDAIVEFDSRLLRAGVKEAQGAADAAQANVDLAQDAAERLSRLKDSDSITEQQAVEARIRVMQAKAVHRQAQGAVERLRVQIDDTVLRAEIPGVVRGLPTILGMAVQPGQSLGRIESAGAPAQGAGCATGAKANN